MAEMQNQIDYVKNRL